MREPAATVPPDGRWVVTLCIPAYEAASFIERTLRCAREQTYAAQRILVSIDLSTDDTERICRAHAAQDPRIEVFAHRERRGWAGNVNFLLDQVGSEFGGLYFHDDLIEPTYSERLVSALSDRPDAAGAHCDVGLYGGSETLAPGRAYDGPPASRLLDYLSGTRQQPRGGGAMLRSMLRTELAGDVRMPTRGGGVWANQPFQMKLVAAGPVVHIPETLYTRWDERRGGLTDAWHSYPFEQIVAGYRTNAEEGLRIIDSLGASPEEREALLFGLFLHITLRLRASEREYGASAVHPPDVLLPEFAGITLPSASDNLPPSLLARYEETYDRLLRHTGMRALEVGDHAQAVAAYEELTRRHPEASRMWKRLGQALRGVERTDEAQEAEQRARRLRRERSRRSHSTGGDRAASG